MNGAATRTVNIQTAIDHCQDGLEHLLAARAESRKRNACSATIEFELTEAKNLFNLALEYVEDAK